MSHTAQTFFRAHPKFYRRTFLFGSEDLKLHTIPTVYTVYKCMATPFYSMVWCLVSFADSVPSGCGGDQLVSVFQISRMVANLRQTLKLTRALRCTIKLSFLRGFDSTSWSNLRSGVIFVLLCLKTDNSRDKWRGHDRRLILEPWLVLV